MSAAAEPFRSADAVLASELGAWALERALAFGRIDLLADHDLEPRALPNLGELMAGERWFRGTGWGARIRT